MLTHSWLLWLGLGTGTTLIMLALSWPLLSPVCVALFAVGFYLRNRR